MSARPSALGEITLVSRQQVLLILKIRIAAMPSAIPSGTLRPVPSDMFCNSVSLSDLPIQSARSPLQIDGSA